ncbi:MAG: SpoIIE family protein phosphatase [Balneolaceae bacterium]
MKSSRTEEEYQSRFKLKTLLETSRLLIESRETDFVLNNLLLITMGKLLVTRAAILIHEPESGTYRVSRIKGKGLVSEGEQIQLSWESQSIPKNVIDPNLEPLSPPSLFKKQESGLFFNLRTSNHHLGYLYLGNKANGSPLNKHEIEFVESLTIISSVAIANSRMFSEMRNINRTLDRRVYELNTLFDLSKDFSAMVDREKIANTFKFALLGQLLIRNFFLIYKVNDKLELLGSNGLQRNPGKNEKQELFDLSDGIQYNPEGPLTVHPFLKENRITAMISLTLQGEKTAVVGVGERANRESYKDSDFHFLESLGNLTILSIQKTIFLNERIEVERLEEELSIARTIQRGLLPDPIPEVPGLDLAGVNIPSSKIGGDYFDIVQSPDGNSIFAIGDVTGKGIPASLLMANLQSMLHVLLPVEITLADATGRINDLIHENTPSDKFVTFFWAKFFHKEKRLRYVNAGHNPPVLIRSGSDTPEELDESGLILGAMPASVPYKEIDVELKTGDILVMYTDGVTESFNEEEEEFGEERLFQTILSNREHGAKEIQQAIVDQVFAYSGDTLSDDMTMIVFKVS